MLHEISTIKHKSYSQLRRWFSDKDMDLFVWFVRHVPVGFQLSYDKQTLEKSVYWDGENGFQHYAINLGEFDSNEQNMPPLRLSDDNIDIFTIARNFLNNCDHINTSLADFIYARLLEYPYQNETHLDQGVVLNNAE